MKTLLLDRNENQYGPAPGCYEVLRNANPETLSLYSRDFVLGRKSELSYQLGNMVGIPEDRVLLTYGAEDMLKQVVHCYLHKGETLLLPAQSWWYYKSLANEVHGNHVEYSLHEGEDRFGFDLPNILKLYDEHKPNLILVASPNNPTGNSISEKDLHALIHHCRSSVIVLDEAYYGFRSESNGHIKQLLEQYPRLAILRTFSKYYALAGLRIGYACVGAELKDIVNFSARYLGYNQLTEQIALAALNDPKYYTEIASRINSDIAMYVREFSDLEGFKPFDSDANFLLLRYPSTQKEPLKNGLKARGVIVKFLDDPGLEDCIRITIGTHEQNRAVISAFKEVMAQL